MDGAYGFRLRYPEALSDLVALDDSAPVVDLACRLACAAQTFDSHDGRTASLGTRGASAFYVTREPPSILVDVGFEPSPDALVHPIATAPLAVLARWRGDVTLHGGAFAAGGRAWALFGERHAGKSTTLALIARRGCPVVTDDLLVVDPAGDVWSGPHCVDLREDAAERLGYTRDLGSFGGRRRLRLAGEPAPARLALGGFFLLDWRAEGGVAVERLSLRDRVRALHALEYVGLVGPADPQAVLELASLPAWSVVRSHDWSAAEHAVDRILETVG